MKKQKKSKPLSNIAIISFIASLLLSSFLIGGIIINRLNVEELQMEQLILEKSLRINEVLSRLLFKTETLAMIAIQDDGSIENFDRIAHSLVDDPAILNVLMAPDGIVTHVYSTMPLEPLIGFDFFADSDGNQEAMLAVETRRLVMAGPFIGRQGEWIITGRLPVFLDSPSERQAFWGLVSVTLRFPQALDGVELGAFSAQGFAYELWRINPNTGERQVIANNLDEMPLTSGFIEKPIQFLNAEWYLKVSPTLMWYTDPENLALFLIGLFISLLVLYIMQSNFELRAAERTLEEAARIAEEASKSKSIFLANMSHEIRTPINGVIGFAELALEDREVSDTVKDRLIKIKDGADTLLDIVNGILDISKIESGKLEVESIPFDLREILNTCKSILNFKAEERGITLCFNSERITDTKLTGDPTKLRQVLLNLLSNAIKFTERGIVELIVAEDGRRDNNLTIRFEVKDSGIGMTEEQMKNVFEAFMQSDISTTRKYGGTGLGLAISKSYVELMGGDLHVESV
ncbi:MAG: ATP-binding protein, partial [Defluviitaleaceae bacterium]|nr:ATP-binding protein [Defluviitaleaceae bacterium]